MTIMGCTTTLMQKIFVRVLSVFFLDYTFYHNFFNYALVFFICEPLRHPK
eukprot:COSAG01_NODE_2838_length_6992_cov_21.639779_3_plen_50_part_00